MKILKMSLVMIVAIGTLSSVNASESLQEAFTNGKYDAALKAFYFDRDKGNGTKKGSILNLGATLNYQTDYFYGFRLGLGAQTSDAPFVDEDGKNAFKGDMYGSGAVLSQAYLDYTVSKTTFKIGRQYISMPLIKSSGSRLIKQSFEGFTAISKDIENTILYGGYVTRFQNRTDGSGDIADFEDLSGDYAYALGVVNKSIPNITLTLAYGEADESHDMYYLEAKYKNKTDSFSYNIAGQYSQTDYVLDSKEDASFYGIKVGAGMGGFNAYVAYTEVEDGTASFSVVGHGTKPTIYTTAKIMAGDYSESKQYAIDLNYKFDDIKLKVGARYIDIDYETDDSADIKIAYANYKFSGALKNLSAALVYEDKDHNINNKDYDELWLKLVYKF